MKIAGRAAKAVYEAAPTAADHARSGRGRGLMAVETYRLVGGGVGGPQVYRN